MHSISLPRRSRRVGFDDDLDRGTTVEVRARHRWCRGEVRDVFMDGRVDVELDESGEVRRVLRRQLRRPGLGTVAQAESRRLPWSGASGALRPVLQAGYSGGLF